MGEDAAQATLAVRKAALNAQKAMIPNHARRDLRIGGSEMFEIWTDQDAHTFEMKQENGDWWYRKQGDRDDKWEKGRPPGFLQKAINL